MTNLAPARRALAPREMRHFLNRRGAAVFSPLSLPNLIGWYDFADIATLWKDTARTIPATADGDIVKGVTDKSGAGNHLSEATNGPTLKLAVQNGKHALLFDGTNDWLSKTSFDIASSAASVITVLRANSLASTRYALEHHGGDLLAIDATASDRYRFYHQGGAGYTGQRIPAANTSWTVVSGVVDEALATAEAQIWVDGSNAGLVQDFNSNNTPAAFGSHTLGVGAGAVGTAFWTGYIGEVVICASALSASNRQAGEAGFKTKWGTP